MGFFSDRTIVSYDVVTAPTTANDKIPEFNKLLAVESVVHSGGIGAVYKKFITKGAAANARRLYKLANSDPLIGLPTSNVVSYSALDPIFAAALAEVTPVGQTAEIVDSFVTTLKQSTLEDGETVEYRYLPNYRGLQTIITGEMIKYFPGISYTNLNHSTLYPYNGAEYAYYEIIQPSWAATMTGGLFSSPYYKPHWSHDGMFSLTGTKPTTSPNTTVQAQYAFYKQHPDVLFADVNGYEHYPETVRWSKAVNSQWGNPYADATSRTAYFNNRNGLDRPYAIIKYRLSPTGTIFTHYKDVTQEFTGNNIEVGLTDTIINAGFGYLPIIPIRENWKWVEDNPDVQDKSFPLIKGKYPTKKEVYDSTKKIMKTSAFSLETLLESMQSTDGGNSPSKMRSIYYGYFADTATDNPQTLKYLFEYFKDLIPVGEFTKANWTAWSNLHTSRSAEGAGSDYAMFGPGALSSTPPIGYRMPYTQQNEVNISTKKYSLTLLYNYATSTIKTGVIGSKGDVTKQIVPQAPLVFYQSGGGNYKGTTYEVKNGSTKELKGRGQYFLRKQLSANSYEEVEVHGLMHVYMPKWNTAIVRTTVDMARADGDVDLNRSVYIPIMFNHLNKLSTMAITTILADCSGYVVYAQESTEVSWYESASFFRAVKAVLIAVFAVVGMPEVGAAIVAGLSALKILVNILVTYLVSKVAEIIIKELGLENSFIALVVIAIVSIVAPDSITLNFGMFELTASMILASSIAATNKIINDNMASLQYEINKHEDLLEEKQKEIDEAVDLLASNNPEISYLLINKRPQYILDATPEIFYSRTVETIDFPNLSTEFVDSFHSRNLDLDILYR